MDNLKLNAIKDEFETLLARVEKLRSGCNIEKYEYDYLKGPLNRIEKLLKEE